MKNRYIRWLAVFGVIVLIFAVIFPKIEIFTDYKFIACRYSDDTSEFENEISFNGKYAYYEKRDVSVSNYDIRKFLCFYVIIMDYEEGNYCDTQFLIDESYINAFIEFAVIYNNSKNVDVEKLIDGKRPIMGNVRYIRQDNAARIDYDIEGEEAAMFVYTVDDLQIFEIVFPDEGPHYIAYK